jgi:PAS domain S-box-containing protein
MRSSRASFLRRYGCAVAGVGLATGLRLLFDPVPQDRFPFATVLFAVMVAAWLGGFGPAVTATLLGALASDYFLLPPRHGFAVEGFENQAGMVLYLGIGLGIAVLGGVMRAAHERVERAVEAEQAQREQLLVTLESISDGVIATDREGRVTFLNPVAQALTGCTGAEAQGRPLEAVFRIANAEIREPVENPVASVLRTGQVVGLANHTVFLDKGGTERPIEGSAAPIMDVKRVTSGVVLVFRDVSERKRWERFQENHQKELERQVQEGIAALRSSEEQFRLLVEGTTDYAIFMLDPQGRVRSWNPGAGRIKGYRADEIIGQHFSCFYPAEDKAKAAHALEVARTTGRFEGEGWRVRKDGSRFWANVILTALHDENGQLLGFSKITRELTEAKRAEEALRAVNADLENRVRERTHELRRAVEDLNRSNLDLAQFAYAASHDLQEPLRAVSGCAQVLQRRYRGRLDERADELIAHTVDGVSRMQTLINGLLAYSRVGSRGRAFGATDCNAVLEGAVANLASAVAGAGAVVTHDLLPVVRADPGQLTQLFQNLVGNAVKFHGADPPRVHVGAGRRAGEWLFTVADNGIGIPAEYFERIFAVFQRLHTRDEFPGTGIGLALCKKIVERHGGRIWLESEPGRGSTFFFTIPETEQPHEPTG